jgi:hypothetical protein
MRTPYNPYSLPPPLWGRVGGAKNGLFLTPPHPHHQTARLMTP